MKFILKLIENELHKESMRIGFLFLFLSWYDSNATQDMPMKFEEIGFIMVTVGAIFLIIDILNKREQKV